MATVSFACRRCQSRPRRVARRPSTARGRRRARGSRETPPAPRRGGSHGWHGASSRRRSSPGRPRNSSPAGAIGSSRSSDAHTSAARRLRHDGTDRSRIRTEPGSPRSHTPPGCLAARGLVTDTSTRTVAEAGEELQAHRGVEPSVAIGVDQLAVERGRSRSARRSARRRRGESPADSAVRRHLQQRARHERAADVPSTWASLSNTGPERGTSKLAVPGPNDAGSSSACSIVSGTAGDSVSTRGSRT